MRKVIEFSASNLPPMSWTYMGAIRIAPMYVQEMESFHARETAVRRRLWNRMADDLGLDFAETDYQYDSARKAIIPITKKPKEP